MAHAPAATFKVGDKVWIPLAVGRACGTIIEDRGPLGVSGQRSFRVSVPNDPYVADEFLVQEGEIQHLDDKDQAQMRVKLSADAIEDFLISGGLISILHHNSPERVWLRPDSQGNLTYTFIEGYSATGGQPAPRWALHGEKVFAADATASHPIH